MKKNTKNENQIVAILKEAEAGVPVEELLRTHGISKSTFYKWKAKYGGLDRNALQRLKELEAENQKLKQLYAELSLAHAALKEVLEKNA